VVALTVTRREHRARQSADRAAGRGIRRRGDGAADGYQFTGSIPYYVAGSLIVESCCWSWPGAHRTDPGGRIGARYAAELAPCGSLSRSTRWRPRPVTREHLIIPRCCRVLMIPVLTIVADVTGVVSGWLAVQQVAPVTTHDFTYGAGSSGIRSTPCTR